MKALVQLHILLLAQAWVDPSLACNQNQYWKEMKCCDKCPPGQKLVTTCTIESDTQCVDCATGEYQDTWNTDKNCQPFSYCDHNAGFVQRSTGTAERDAACECVPGKHCSSPQCETCVWHTPCAPGFGVVKEANNLIDTECEKCASGTFSNETSLTEPCHRWTSCDVSSNEVKELGSPFSDVTCGFKAKASRSVWPVFVVVGIVVILTALVLYCFRDKDTGDKTEVLPSKGTSVQSSHKL